MSKRALRAAILAGVALYVLPVQAQEKSPDLVITPNRIPMSIQQIGSSVTVITQDEIEKQGNKSLRDILDGQPGDRKSTRLNSSHTDISRMPSSA